ncbi:MAG TPA: ferritin-like domain-containing protein [Methylomirabilota bacterium]|nr:ferritin-like domain-containing protein [Methylomirabilota bacterium]
MKLETLRELYIEELRDIYDAENQLVKALPKMAKAATNEELSAAFEEHLEQTEAQVERLNEIFEMLEEKPKGGKCEAMKGLLEEAKKLMEEDADADVLDAAMIAAAQKVEHYEIASYGTLRTYAEQLELDEQADLLQEILDEEKDADDNLTELAMTCINLAAEGEEEEEEEDEDEEVSAEDAEESEEEEDEEGEEDEEKEKAQEPTPRKR